MCVIWPYVMKTFLVPFDGVIVVAHLHAQTSKLRTGRRGPGSNGTGKSVKPGERAGGPSRFDFFVCQAAMRSSFRMSLNEVETALRNTIAVPAVRTNRTRHASIRQDVAAGSARTIGPISGAATFATSSGVPARFTGQPSNIRRQPAPRSPDSSTSDKRCRGYGSLIQVKDPASWKAWYSAESELPGRFNDLVPRDVGHCPDRRIAIGLSRISLALLA